MKKIYLIGGAMGVGKTTVAQILKTKLSNSVSLMAIGAGILTHFKLQKKQKLWL